jgi:uncharacterized lipoprotein NlpE involved in copper resistance
MKKTILSITILLALLSCKKEEDDTTKNLVTLLALQQAQASAAESAKQAAIAAKPGCKSLVEIKGVGVANKVSLINRQNTNGEIAIKFTIQAGQKLVFEGTGFIRTSMGTFYNGDACSTGDFSRPPGTYSSPQVDTTRREVTYSIPGSYIHYYGIDAVSSNEFVHIE